MARLGNQLDLVRCPHCNVDQPNLQNLQQFDTSDYGGHNRRIWRVYKCARCGGVVTAASAGVDQLVTEVYPEATSVDGALPDRARSYLEQALNSLHAPAGAVMLAASAVDAMLKARGFKEGSMYRRIEQAAEAHLITQEMARWAHEVRLDANDQRHADEEAAMPSSADATRVTDFAIALGQFMFVLPARVQRGLQDAGGA
jgi:DNA-directed RNA polymerase subunit RPC12/RpoP